MYLTTKGKKRLMKMLSSLIWSGILIPKLCHANPQKHDWWLYAMHLNNNKKRTNPSLINAAW